jgi:hypothetical protein
MLRKMDAPRLGMNCADNNPSFQVWPGDAHIMKIENFNC